MLAETIGFWILTGILERFPGLRIVFVEPGLMWVPYYLDKIDRFMSEGAYKFPAIKELPSFYFHRQMALTFMDDARGLRQRDDIGVGNIMWSTDYPHPATTWPHSRESIARQFQGVPDNERELMTCGNAARFYGLN
jgi:predicted TIM-barrel fold metal-dependent hydrolase